MQLCEGCKTFQDEFHPDGAGRLICTECFSFLPETYNQFLLGFLLSSIPYEVGDKVSCKSGGEIYDGIGHIVQISMDPKDLASPVVPMFRVEMDEKAYPEMPDEMWYSEPCLEAANG